MRTCVLWMQVLIISSTKNSGGSVKWSNAEIKVYSYRWVVLLVYFIINALMQMQWITFAPITSEAVAFYKVPAMQIDLLSLIFMIVYLFVSFPASYIIDTWGIRIGIGIGAALMGVFGFMKGFYGANYNMVVIAQIGIAVGQPFVLEFCHQGRGPVVSPA